MDYGYTLQGWLKGINGDILEPYADMAQDGHHSGNFKRVSKDVYIFKLGYYDSDYLAIGNTNPFGNYNYISPSSLEETGNQLFNGNISYTTLILSKLSDAVPVGYTYGYDQLNRLVEMRFHNDINTDWDNGSIIDDYKETISYDANGNILTYLRNGTSNVSTDMDDMTYGYYDETNRLNYVSDNVDQSGYDVDIDNQEEGNYVYDLIGNLVSDAAEELDDIDWTVYGKIKGIYKSKDDVDINIFYGYDAGGNRTSKQVVDVAEDTSRTTFYIRDAQGNVLAIYSFNSAENVQRWDEQHLYGSSRLGMWQWGNETPVDAPIVISTPIFDSIMLGSRVYELTNHLGNVLSTISDKKIGNDSSGVVNFYIAEVLSQNDYYPFGMGMVGRQYSANDSYRFGFNGKENDNEVKGDGNQQDYGMRIYDVRLGRFLSLDPLGHSFPWNSPFAYAENDVIRSIDLDGFEKVNYMERVPANGWVDGFLKTPGNTFVQASNSAAAAWNGGVSLFQAFEEGGVPGLFNEIGKRWNYFEEHLDLMIQYHKETSLRKQLQDAGSFIANPDNFYITLEQTTLFYASSRVLPAVKPVTGKPTTAQAIGAAGAKYSTSKRPTPVQSERQLTPIGSGEINQARFKNGNLLNSNLRGHVRPESYNMLTFVATEVKNFTFRPDGVNNRSISTLVRQIRQRQVNLPSGSVQNIIVDIRGQNVPLIQQMHFRSQVLHQTRTPNVNIIFQN